MLHFKRSLEPSYISSQSGEPLTLRVRDWLILLGLRLLCFNT